MGEKYLSDVKEVVERLNSKDAKNFHRKLQALLNPKGGTKFLPGGIITPEFYEEEFGIAVGPRLTDEQAAKLEKYGFRILFIPAITEDKYPESFSKPEWGRYLNIADIKRQPLPGRFVAIETIAKPNWDDPNGYPDDKLGQVLGLKSRFGVSWDELYGKDGILAKAAQVLGFPSEQVRSPYAEEYNFVGNMFNYLRNKFNEPLPDLGSTNSWEWCENVYGSNSRLIGGGRERGGLAGVHCRWRGTHDGNVAFRVLVVL